MSPDSSKEPSEEVDERQLQQARAAGDSYLEAVEYMATEVANTGGKHEAGDYVVGFAQEEAEGMYAPTGDGRLQWTEPESANCHLEVAVADADDGRFVPELTIIATLHAEDGTRVGPFEVPFLWHPGLYHYGRNVEVPGDGTYTLEVRVEPPSFKRHDRTNGERYADPVETTFEDVEITTGRR